MMKEEWKEVKGFEGAYMVSNMGRVYSLLTEMYRALSFTHDGYAKVRLIHNGKDETHRVHRLVAEAFVSNPDGKETVNHKDGNKQNNRYDNLEWADRHEQLYHAYQMGLKKPMSGAENPNAKLTDDQVEEIRTTYVRNSKEFGTVALSRKYGVTNAVIGRVVRGVGYA